MRKILNGLLILAAVLSLTSCSLLDSFNVPEDSSTIIVSDDITITDKQTVIDNETFFLEITEVSIIDKECEITYKAKNLTTDTDYELNIEDLCVNSVQTSVHKWKTISAEEEMTLSLTFNTEDFNDIDIGKYTDIEIEFVLTDSEEYSTIADVTVNIYPYGEDEVILYEREEDDEDIILIDTDELSITAISNYIEDDEYIVCLYIKNKTDIDLDINAEHVSINGITCTSNWLKTISANKCTFCNLSWDEDTLNKVGISLNEIEEIEITFKAYENGDSAFVILSSAATIDCVKGEE